MAAPFKTGERFVLCKWCDERPVPPSCIRRREYACSRCRHQRPAGVAARARYNAGPLRKAVSARSNARRIFTGQGYHSTARSAEEAQRINAVIKERVSQFRATQRGDAHTRTNGTQ